MAEHWAMPDWMEEYRDLFANTGGNSLESLMNDKGTNIRNNPIRVALITAVDAQVHLLAILRREGKLK